MAPNSHFSFQLTYYYKFWWKPISVFNIHNNYYVNIIPELTAYILISIFNQVPAQDLLVNQANNLLGFSKYLSLTYPGLPTGM